MKWTKSLIVRVSVLLACTYFGGGGACVGASGSTPHPVVELCSAEGRIVRTEATRLRDEIGDLATSKAHLLAIQGALGDAMERCSGTLTALDAEFAGAIHVVLGNRLLNERTYEAARDAFSSAMRPLEHFDTPSLMRLAALEGVARAELALRNLQRAGDAAATQTSLARTWVRERGFVQSALVDALRFEAQVYAAKRQGDKARELTEEAKRIESEADDSTRIAPVFKPQ